MMDFPQMLMGDEDAYRTQVARSVEELRQWLHAQEQAYGTAVGKFRDMGWLQDAVRTSATVLEALRSFDSRHDPETTAVYLVAQATLSLGSVHDQLAVIEGYESRHEQLNEILNTIQRHAE